jgi:antitoxin YefM
MVTQRSVIETAGLRWVSHTACRLDDPKLDMYSYPYISKDGQMDAITYTTARARLAETMDRVCDEHDPIIITRNGEQAVVMISLDDYKALEETSYLLRSPKNARRLLEAMAELQDGKGRERQLAE